jgi:phytanoyl-CoA hydroxylase
MIKGEAMPATALAVESCPAILSAAHVEAYRRDGFLAFNDFLDKAAVTTLREAMTELVRSLCLRAKMGALPVERGSWDGMRNYSGLKIEDGKSKLGLLMEPEIGFDLCSAPFESIDNSYRKISHPTRGSEAFKNFSEDPKLVPMLEALIGPKPILYGDMALCKPPRIGSEKPWHQDGAYFTYEPFGAGVDVWLALDDAAIENGCMFVLPGAHKLGPKKHVHLNDCTVAEGRYDYSQAVPVELRAGGILFFSTLLPHYTPPNRSEMRRRAVQLFYRAAHTRLVDAAEHGRCFVEADGTPAACSAVKG